MRLAALLLCAGAICAQQSSPEQLFGEAVAAQQRGDDALAVRKYQELLKTQPDVMEVRANLGAALARLGRYDEAIEQYRAALARNQSNTALRLNLGLAYYKKGDLAAAVRQLSRLHAAEPANAQVALLLADCYTRLGQDAQAAAILSPLEAAHPEDLTVAWLLGSTLIRSGHPSEGLKLVERVAQRGNNADAYLLAGQTALRLTQFERARDDAEAALRLNPRLAGVETLRGQVLQYLGDNQGAVAALRKALAQNADDFDAHLTLGAVLQDERDLEGASRHLGRAIELNPRSVLARYELARLQRAKGQLDAAVRNFEQVVREDPDWAQPHVELAALYFKLQRPEDGQRERAIFDRLNAASPKPGTTPRLPPPPR